MHFFLFILLSLFIGVLSAQPSLNKAYGEFTANSGYTVFSENNGFLISGGGYSTNFNNWYGIKVYRVDSLGNILWQREYGKAGKAYQTPSGAIKTFDGGYAIPGWIKDGSTGNYTALLLKINNQGDTMWAKTFSGSDVEDYKSCVEVFDKGILAFGQTNNMGDINGDFLLVKYDSNGTQMWARNYGGNKQDAGAHVALLSDGGFLLSGMTKSFGNGLHKNYLVRTDSNGDTLWTRTYGTNGDNGGCIADVMSDGNFLMTGLWDTIIHNGFGGASYVAKLDTSGNILWIKLFVEQGNIGINNAAELSNGDIVVVGQRDKPVNYFYGGYLCRLDHNGSKKWERTLLYNGSDVDTTQQQLTAGSFYDVKPTNNGGIVMTGTSNYRDSDTSQTQKIWLVKTDSTGCIDTYCGFTGVEEISYTNDIPTTLHIYPNPAANQVTIEIPPTITDDAKWAVYNLLGQQIATGKTQGQPNVKMEVSVFQKGWYVVKIIAKDKSYVGKFLVE